MQGNFIFESLAQLAGHLRQGHLLIGKARIPPNGRHTKLYKQVPMGGCFWSKSVCHFPQTPGLAHQLGESVTTGVFY